MKKTISICFFAVILLLISVFAIFLFRKQWKPDPDGDIVLAEETEEVQEAAESMTLQKPCTYIILEQDGVLVVYDPTGKTALFETNIRFCDLDTDLQEKVSTGIRFLDEKELYDFLESYSS